MEQLPEVLGRIEYRYRRAQGLILLCALAAVARGESVKQGGVVRVHAPATAISARMGERTIRLFSENGGNFGLMPVPLDQKPGEYKLELLDKSGAVVLSEPVDVVDAHYLKRNVTIQPGIAELKPTPEETEMSAEFRKTVSDVRYWQEPLEPPVRGCITSPYGVQSYLNGKPTGSAHSGLDQRSPAGAPIRAAAAGVVKLARDWPLHGRTVAIDHGQGVESMYLHMSKQAVAEGAKVSEGDIIGYVGTTGRSNAPHLHWSLYVNGVPVNPNEWVKLTPCTAARKPAAKKRTR